MRHLLLMAALILSIGISHAAAADISVDYACADGTTFTITFLNAPSGDAVVKLDGSTIKLAAQPVGSGMWYSSGRHEFRGKGEEATWTVGRRAPTQCHAVAQQ